MKTRLVDVLVQWGVTALGVMLAANIVSGVDYDDGKTLIVVVLWLSLLNAILKPLLVLVALPLIVLTMGLGVMLVNAVLFLMVDRLVDGFHVASIWSALGGALVVSLTDVMASGFKSRKRVRAAGDGEPAPPPPRKPKVKDDDVIDI